MSDIKRKTLTLHQAYKKVLSGPQGELVLQDLKERGFYDRSSLAADAHLTVFNEGRRSIVLHVLSMMDESKFKHLAEESK